MSDEKINHDEQILDEAAGKGPLSVLKSYVKLSGPGWLQSAITLGGGSLAGALFLGVIGGTSLLWVQLAAMIMGVIMLSAIAYVTLSTGKSPYKMIRDDVNPVLAYGWLIASLLANMIWVMPQYSLSYSAITQNLAPNLFEDPNASSSKWIISLILFTFCTTLVMAYGKGGKGQKVFDIVIKLIVGLIVLSFMVVSFKIIFIDKQISFGDVLSGFIPNFSDVTEPVSTFQPYLNEFPAEVKSFWNKQILATQQIVLVAAAAFAVGINMTFMMPYSILGRGWNKKFRGLAIFDLSTGMVIPFVLATSCVVIASSAAFHGKPIEGAYERQGQEIIVNTTLSKKIQSGLKASLAKRQEAVQTEVSDKELELMSMLVKRDTGSFTDTLSSVVGEKLANLIFGLGVLAMGISTITMLMLISGFCVCELFNLEHGGKWHKWGTLLASTGIFWHIVWGSSGAYLAVVTGSIGFVFLPLAYIAFFLLMNSKKAMGDERPKGKQRWTWNILMGLSTAFTTYAAFGSAWGKKMKIGGSDVAFGQYFVVSCIVLIVLGQIYMVRKHKKAKSVGEE